MRNKLLLIGVPILILLVAWWSRRLIVRLMPMDHEGVVLRISTFDKGWRGGDTRQQRQFILYFEGGFECEAHDSSFAVVEKGDRIRIRGYHDTAGFPLLNPEWGECDEAQLVTIVEPGDGQR